MLRLIIATAAAVAAAMVAAAPAHGQQELLSTTVQIVGDEIVVRDTANDGGRQQDLELLRVVESGTETLRLRERGDTRIIGFNGCETREPGVLVVCPTAGITEVDIDTGSLDDVVEARNSSVNAVTLPLVMRGGPGRDELQGGIGPDTLNGQGGDDRLEGSGGDDTLVGGTAADELGGGPGTDIVSYNDGHDGVAVRVDGEANDGDALDASDTGNAAIRDDVDVSVETIVGTPGADRIEGAQQQVGRDGDDILFGLFGDDLVRGGLGDDVLQGGPGGDLLVGEEGRDQLTGQEDDDELRGGIGPDVLVGGTGRDTVRYDVAPIGESGVTVTVGLGADDGGDSDDGPVGGETVRDNVHATVERVIGSPVAGPLGDALTGSEGDEDLVGLAGDDRLEGGAGADAFDAGTGDDEVLARDGAADRSVACGDGQDTVVADAADPVAADCEVVDVPDPGPTPTPSPSPTPTPEPTPDPSPSPTPDPSPSPTPDPSPSPTPNPSPSPAAGASTGTGLAATTPDRVPPDLRATSVRRGRAIRVTVSEAATVKIAVARRGRRIASLTRALAAGRHTVTLRAPVRRRDRVTVEAVDAAGNSSRTVAFRGRAA